MGPSYGLVRRDIDVSNKTDQRSAERMIAEPVINGLKECEWSLGTSFYIRLAKAGFEAWWNPDFSPIDRISSCYYVLKVFHLWRKWLILEDLDLKQHFITLELYRDTILMCSSLVHIALVFKLFLPEKAFLPWKWSEYPLESYFSSVRFLFGNDDEFSTLEYMHRVQKLQHQRSASCDFTGSRNKAEKSNWKHPKLFDKSMYPHLFAYDWKLEDLLKRFQHEDEKIVREFKELGSCHQTEFL